MGPGSAARDGLDLALDLVAAGRCAHAGSGLPPGVLERLRALVPCDAVRLEAGGPHQPPAPDDSHCGAVLTVPLGPRCLLLLLRRGGPPFTARERAVVALLRPHLQDIWRSAEERRAGRPVLTAREWQVLALAGSGCSNADIAARLQLSVGTVRKHMEHVLHRLDVHSRGAAAAVALPYVPLQASRTSSVSDVVAAAGRTTAAGSLRRRSLR